MQIMKITDRTRIRKPVSDDARFLAEIENNPEVKKFIWGPSGKSEAQYRKKIAEMQDDCEWLIIDSLASNKPIGRCGLIVDGDKSEIHIILAKHYWKQNLGTEVALALAQLSAEKFPDKTLFAKVHPDNFAAISIIKKLGMIRRGTISEPGRYDDGFLKFGRSGK
jgi:RimJ/RimL family protein N-acetyltransferase